LGGEDFNQVNVALYRATDGVIVKST